jgi:hypothetical protein
MIMRRLRLHEQARGEINRTAMGVLRVAFFGRAVVNAWLIAFLVGHRTGSIPDLIELLSLFLIVDGALACVSALIAAVATPRLWVWLFAAVDGLARLALGSLVQLAPGIPGFPVTAVIYLGLVSVVICLDGITDIVGTVEWRSVIGGRWAHVVSVSLGLVLITIGAVIFLSVGEADAFRGLFVLLSASQVLLLLTAAFEARTYQMPASGL